MARDTSGDSVLREPALSKRTWTFQKTYFAWKFKGKMPDADSGASILCETAQSKRTWAFRKSHFMEIYRKNATRASYHLDQTPGLNCYGKNPFSVATLFGEKTPDMPLTIVDIQRLILLIKLTLECFPSLSNMRPLPAAPSTPSQLK